MALHLRWRTLCWVAALTLAAGIAARAYSCDAAVADSCMFFSVHTSSKVQFVIARRDCSTAEPDDNDCQTDTRIVYDLYATVVYSEEYVCSAEIGRGFDSPRSALQRGVAMFRPPWDGIVYVHTQTQKCYHMPRHPWLARLGWGLQEYACALCVVLAADSLKRKIEAAVLAYRYT
jgi:hypothetical protein